MMHILHCVFIILDEIKKKTFIGNFFACCYITACNPSHLISCLLIPIHAVQESSGHFGIILCILFSKLLFISSLCKRSSYSRWMTAWRWKWALLQECGMKWDLLDADHLPQLCLWEKCLTSSRSQWKRTGRRCALLAWRAFYLFLSVREISSCRKALHTFRLILLQWQLIRFHLAFILFGLW